MFCVFSNFDGKYVPILFQYIFSGKHRVRSLSPIYVQTCQFWLMWLPSHCRPKGLQSAPPLLALQVFRVQGAPCGSWCGGWRNREMGTIPWVSTHPKAQNHRGTLKDMNVLSDSISHFYMSRIWIYFWVNCNISLTWIVRPWLGIISHIKTMIPGFGRTVRSWWNLPRYMCIYILYIQCHNSPILFPSYPIKSLFTQIFGFVQHPQVSSAPWLENPPWLHLGDFPVPGSDVAWWIPGVPNVAMAIGGTYHIW